MEKQKLEQKPKQEQINIKAIEDWERKEKDINEKAEHAKEFWGFSSLRNSTNLANDIGKEVYYALGMTVYKGKIMSVNCYGMCAVSMYDGGAIYLSMQKLFGNVHYALCNAKYNEETDKIKGGEK